MTLQDTKFFLVPSECVSRDVDGGREGEGCCVKCAMQGFLILLSSSAACDVSPVLMTLVTVNRAKYHQDSKKSNDEISYKVITMGLHIGLRTIDFEGFFFGHILYH